jgi:hypothetical protein
MKPQSYQLFSQMCESVVFEASTSMDIIKGLPGGAEVIQQLHREGDLGHEQAYKPIAKIAWSELKDSYRGAWVIMKYPKGVGAIKATGGNTGSYVASASTGGPAQNFSDSRGGNVLDFLKRTLGGNPVKMWAGNDTGNTKTLKKSRYQDKQSLEKATITSPEALVKKFRPLWLKILVASQGDIKGVLQTMIKNHSFDKADRKLSLLKKINQGIYDLENNPETKLDFLNSAINQAVHMAAVHFYPEETGEVTRTYNGWTSSSGHGVQNLLHDIATGDQAKLGAVLKLFKRAVVSG